MFIFAFILLALGLIALVLGVFKFKIVVTEHEGDRYRASRTTTEGRVLRYSVLGAGAFLVLLSALILFFNSFYTQERGEAVVLKDITGNIVGQTNDTGWKWKAPWVDTVVFNVLDQPVYFLTAVQGAETNDSTYRSDGPHVTVQDADGVSSDIDVTLVYSIKPSEVTDIYSRYKDEDTFKTTLVYQDIRSVVRSVANKFTTIELLTQRGEFEAAIIEALEAKWTDRGVIVSNLALQEIRPPAAVVESYAAAQQAQINVSKAEADLAAAEVSAQQKVAQAKAEAEANAILNSSLTNEILQQRYLDTLAKLAEAGNLVVVPEGFNGLVSIK